MKIQPLLINFSESRHLRLRLCALAVVAFVALTGCDIQPVAVGSWDVRIADQQGSRQETWTITDTRQITLAGDNGTVTTDVELAGSRVSWTTGSMATDATDRVNFSGTVDGNQLAGTLYAQQGNSTVTGTRR